MALRRAHTLLFIVLFLSTLPFSIAASTNVTVDDEYGDEVTLAMPKYTPADVWNFGPNCTVCRLMPDSSQAYNGTWHDSTVNDGQDPYTIEVNFTGYAVYAYLILAGQMNDAVTQSFLTFSLDGTEVSSFSYGGTNKDFRYNFLAYYNENLENTAHTFVISSVPPSGGSSNCIFDRLVYTTGDGDPATPTTSSLITSYINYLATSTSTFTTTSSNIPLSSISVSGTSQSSTPSTSSSSSSSKDAVIGGSIGGGIAAIAISVLALLCLRWRRRRWQGGDSSFSDSTLTPYLERPKPSRSTTMVQRPERSDGDNGVVAISQSRAALLALGPGKRASLFVAPPSSVTNVNIPQPPAPQPTPPRPVLFLPEKDISRGEESDRPSPHSAVTRATASSSSWSTPNSDRAAPNPLSSDRHGRRPQASTQAPNERELLNTIATLQAEMDLLRGRDSRNRVPPPGYYGDQESSGV